MSDSSSERGAVNGTVETEMRKVRGQWRALLERVVAEALDHFGIKSVPAHVVTTYLVAFWYGMEMEMVLGVSEEEGHYWSGLAAFERFLRWLEAEVRAGRRPMLV